MSYTKIVSTTLLALLIFTACGGGSSQDKTSSSSSQESQEEPNSSLSSSNTTTIIKTQEPIEVILQTPTQCQTEYSNEILEGRVLYNANCKVCHASDAKSGQYDIRGSLVSDIDAAMQSVPDMIALNLESLITPQQRSLLSLYLIEIKKSPQVEFATTCETEELLSEATLGSRLFFDANLSLRRTLSCSSCHNPAYAFSDARFKQSGASNPVAGALSLGDNGVTLGGRNAPTLLYAQYTPAFSKNSNQEYIGGQFHDGRASTLAEQAKGPILDSAEMMLPDAATLVARVLENPTYVEDFKALYGESIFDEIERAYSAIAQSIAAFEKTELFAPFSSKYDRSRLDKDDALYYAMSEQEELGYALFFNKQKTNCVLCHTINSQDESPKELFTNFKYENIGRPKNLDALMARDGDTKSVDLGLGGRSDIEEPAHYGKVRVPSLRNVAITDPYMSNGVFKSLSTLLAFYNHISGSDSNSLNPETLQEWQEAEVSTTIAHEKLSMELLSESELDALEAFLKLLTEKQYEPLLD